MLRLTARLLLIPAVGLALAACPADRDAVDPPGGEPVDFSPDPRIEEAPALPTPPVGVPVGLEPDTAPRDTVLLDTIPGAVTDTPAATPPATP